MPKDPSSLDLLAAQLSTSAHLLQLAAQLRGEQLALPSALEQARSDWETARLGLGTAEVAPPPPVDEPLADWLEAGAVLGDRYRLVEVSARSGSDVTWNAEELPSGRAVLVTVLRDVVGPAAQEVVERLRRDVGMRARGDHPNVARILDAGLARGAVFLVLEPLRGRPLRFRILTRGGLPVDQAIDVLLQVSAGLEAIHQAGVIHGDIRPENVLLVERKAKLLGFWPALMEAYGRPHVRGNRRYASPEQLASETLDARSDVYSLGVTAYEVLTGSLPFPPTVTARLTGRPMPMPPSVPAAVAKVVLRALEREPALRWPAVEAFGAALRQAWDPFTT